MSFAEHLSTKQKEDYNKILLKPLDDFAGYLTPINQLTDVSIYERQPMIKKILGIFAKHDLQVVRWNPLLDPVGGLITPSDFYYYDELTEGLKAFSMLLCGEDNCADLKFELDAPNLNILGVWFLVDKTLREQYLSGKNKDIAQEKEFSPEEFEDMTQNILNLVPDWDELTNEQRILKLKKQTPFKLKSIYIRGILVLRCYSGYFDHYPHRLHRNGSEFYQMVPPKDQTNSTFIADATFTKKKLRSVEQIYKNFPLLREQGVELSYFCGGSLSSEKAMLFDLPPQARELFLQFGLTLLDYNYGLTEDVEYVEVRNGMELPGRWSYVITEPPIKHLGKNPTAGTPLYDPEIIDFYLDNRFKMFNAYYFMRGEHSLSWYPEAISEHGRSSHGNKKAPVLFGLMSKYRVYEDFYTEEEQEQGKIPFIRNFCERNFVENFCDVDKINQIENSWKNTHSPPKRGRPRVKKIEQLSSKRSRSHLSRASSSSSASSLTGNKRKRGTSTSSTRSVKAAKKSESNSPRTKTRKTSTSVKVKRVKKSAAMPRVKKQSKVKFKVPIKKTSSKKSRTKAPPKKRMRR